MFLVGLLSLPILFCLSGILMIFLLINEYSEKRSPFKVSSIWTTIWALSLIYVIATIAHIQGVEQFSWLVTTGLIAAYFIIGMIWSIYRYNSYVDYELEKVWESHEWITAVKTISSDDAHSMAEANNDRLQSIKQYALARLSPGSCKSIIAHWCIFWPVSILNNVFDIVYDVFNVLFAVIRKGTYDLIFSRNNDKFNQKIESRLAESVKK